MGLTVQETRFTKQWTEAELWLNFFWTSNLLTCRWLLAQRAPKHSHLAHALGRC